MARIDLQSDLLAKLVLISVPLGERFLLQPFAVSRVYAFLVWVSPGGIYILKGKVRFYILVHCWTVLQKLCYNQML